MKLRISHSIILSLVLVTTFSSCKTIKNGTTPQKQNAPIEINDLPIKEVIENVQTTQPAFERAYVKKMSANLQARGREIDAKVTCKLVKDSAIHISVQPFMGIELFKVELTPKSMMIIDKLNKIFYKSNYGIFYERLGMHIGYNEIQSLISNRLFVPAKPTVLPSDFAKKKNTQKIIITHQDDNNINQEITLNNIGRILNVLFEEPVRKWMLNTQYSDFDYFDKILFPKTINISAIGGKEKINFTFDIEKVLFNEKFEMKNAKRTRYKQGNIRTFLKK